MNTENRALALVGYGLNIHILREGQQRGQTLDIVATLFLLSSRSLREDVLVAVLRTLGPWLARTFAFRCPTPH